MGERHDSGYLLGGPGEDNRIGNAFVNGHITGIAEALNPVAKQVFRPHDLDNFIIYVHRL